MLSENRQGFLRYLLHIPQFFTFLLTLIAYQTSPQHHNGAWQTYEGENTFALALIEEVVPIKITASLYFIRALHCVTNLAGFNKEFQTGPFNNRILNWSVTEGTFKQNLSITDAEFK